MPNPCKQCGQPIVGKHPSNMKTQKYCSQKCMAASYRGGPEQFWAKVDKTSHPGGCWLYTGFRKWDGYGWLRRVIDGKGRYMTAHRYSWYLKHGMPAKGIHILHKCDNPPCCNPDHLFLGTHKENMADSVKKLRHSFGERGKNKLSYAAVKEMRRLHAEGWTKEQLAKHFKTSERNAYFIITRRTWKIDAPSPILHPNRVRPRRQHAR